MAIHLWAQDALESLVHVLRLMKASLGVIMDHGNLKTHRSTCFEPIPVPQRVGFAPETMVDVVDEI
jgi:hypothetical protein